MAMYLFGEKESRDFGCFPSYHGKWLVNDWSLGGKKEINELVKIAVSWPYDKNHVDIYDTTGFFEDAAAGKLIQLGPFQLWMGCYFCCHSSKSAEIKEQSVEVNFQITTKVLDATGTREVVVFRFCEWQLSKEDKVEIFKLLEKFAYKNTSTDFSDVAVHVADVDNIATECITLDNEYLMVGHYDIKDIKVYSV